jgi:nitrous oxide reductase accessory protein NosL
MRQVLFNVMVISSVNKDKEAIYITEMLPQNWQHPEGDLYLTASYL